MIIWFVSMLAGVHISLMRIYAYIHIPSCKIKHMHAYIHTSAHQRRTIQFETIYHWNTSIMILCTLTHIATRDGAYHCVLLYENLFHNFCEIVKTVGCNISWYHMQNGIDRGSISIKLWLWFPWRLCDDVNIANVAYIQGARSLVWYTLF